MALQQTLNFESGMVLENAYIRIFNLFGNKGQVTLSVVTFVNKDAALEGKPFVQAKEYYFQPNVLDDAPNFYKQGYEYLKEQPEFEGSIDVLEDGQSA